MNIRTVFSLTAALALGTVFAEEEAAAPEKAAQSEKPAVSAKRVSDLFTTLPFCREMYGKVEVKRPSHEDWEAVEDGHFYPLGSVFRTGEDGTMLLSFGKGCSLRAGNGASFGTRAQALGTAERTVVLLGGTVDLELPDNMPEGVFTVAAPGFVAKNPAGKSRYIHTDRGDGFETTARCVTGTMQVEGRHFAMPRMRAADEFRLRHSRDELETIIYGLSGDFVVRLEQGLFATTEVNDEGARAEKISPRTFDWHLSPETRVQISRAVPSVGEKMAVHTMAFDAAGNLQSECSFCEGRAELNSGELVVHEKKDASDIAKRAAEATETAATEEGAGEKKEEAPKEESAEE